MPTKYVRPYSKGQKNDYRDAEAMTAFSRTKLPAFFGGNITSKSPFSATLIDDQLEFGCESLVWPFL